jgi:adenine-specific DNA-methyltransferase
LSALKQPVIASSEIREPSNRKYLGSKRLLRAWICDIVADSRGVPKSFLDGFCGTGCVGVEMSRRGAARVVAVDNLLSNCVILRGFVAASGKRADRKSLGDLVARLNALDPRPGYIAENFAGTYFTAENCARMDAMREEIERLRAGGEISPACHDYLLASFLLAADRVANTLGQYDAFMKNIDSGTGFRGGRHVVDERVKTPITLQPLADIGMEEVEVVFGDILALMPSISVEAAYFDPPYNGRQYCDNYHVLENLARWEKPPLFGKTRKFDRSAMRSPFSRRSEAAAALGALIAATASLHIFLSYSSEGILSRQSIEEILRRFGEVRVHELPYPVFGNGAGVSRRRQVVEYLFSLERGEGVRGE